MERLHVRYVEKVLRVATQTCDGSDTDVVPGVATSVTADTGRVTVLTVGLT